MDKQTVVFLHGFGSNSRSFDLLKAELMKEWSEAKGYEYIALDFVGFGARRNNLVSEKPLDQAIKDVVETINDRENITLIAHSMGGIPALYAASWLKQKYPDKLKRVALIEGNLVAEDCGKVSDDFTQAETTPRLAKAWVALVAEAKKSSVASIRRWGSAIASVPKPDTFQKYARQLVEETTKGGLAAHFKALTFHGVSMLYIHGDGKAKHAVLNALEGENTAHIKDAGHFVHEDQPKDVAQAIFSMD